MESRMSRLSLALVLALLLAGCGSEEDDAEGGGGGEAIEISGTDFAFSPASVEVDEAGEVTLRLVNDGGMPHALEVEGGGVEEETDEVGPGETAELTVELEAGEYVFYCPVGNHRDQGMEGTLTVGGGAGGAGGEDDDDMSPTTTEDSGGYDY